MTDDMDESFANFYHEEGFGPAIEPRAIPPERIEGFRGRLPDQLLRYWQRYGWAGYGGGLVWTVDPDAYRPALEAWISGTRFMGEDAYHVIARSAFGELLVWGETSGQSLQVMSAWGMLFPRDNSDRIAEGRADQLVRSFFIGLSKRRLDQKDDQGAPLFDRAVATLGPLAADEMYGFEPALALGGKADLVHLRKVKAVEHVVMLAQLGEREIMRDIVKEAKARGLM